MTGSTLFAKAEFLRWHHLAELTCAVTAGSKGVVGLIPELWPMRSTQKFLSHAIELRCEFLHFSIFANHFTRLSTV